MISEPNVKINLGLSVLRRRPDGYHDLETLFVPYMGIRDVLEMDEAEEFSIEIDHCDWDPQSDLTARAYRMLAADFDLPPVRIRLEKHAPVGAGLGGGSADGAFALRMTSEIFGLGLSDEKLAEYASRLGSDCAFFIYNRPMLGEGRGDILTPYELDLGDRHIEVVVPEGISVSTAEAYRGITPRESAAFSGKVVPLRKALAAGAPGWRELLVNDFERTVFAAHPELARIKESLYESGALYASMSGSGSALFCIR